MALQTCPLVKHERILVPLDGSPDSDQALVQAINLAKSCGSKLYLLHVIYSHPEYFLPQQHLDQEKVETVARGLMDTAAGRAERENITYEKVFDYGEPYEQIVQKARENNIDLIVMGSHGRSGLKRMLLGSVTAKVIGHAPCAVLVIPQAASQ